jgi:hypothetical protein
MLAFSVVYIYIVMVVFFQRFCKVNEKKGVFVVTYLFFSRFLLLVTLKVNTNHAPQHNTQTHFFFVVTIYLECIEEQVLLARLMITCLMICVDDCSVVYICDGVLSLGAMVFFLFFFVLFCL